MNEPGSTRTGQLRDLLLQFRASDANERAFIKRMLALTTAPGDALSSEHYLPGHFTASAFVLSPDKRSLLLIFHSKLKRWLQPGGHIDPLDTDVLAAALREVQEETGLGQVVPCSPQIFDVDIHEIPARDPRPAHLHFDVRFLLQATTAEYQAGSDAQAARWVPLHEVNALQSDESVLRAVRKLAA
jgi:8-oxo-dGTP pyrophosphatase MutT (NUDIX family)